MIEFIEANQGTILKWGVGCFVVVSLVVLLLKGVNGMWNWKK